MELYVLDALYRRATVIDIFESCVWTERFNDVGDMTLTVHSTPANRRLLTSDTYLAMNRSNRIMKIDTVEDKREEDGSLKLVCTGTSVERIMEERAARGTMATGVERDPKWILEGLPAAVARELFEKIMVEGVLDPGDVLPLYAEGSLYPEDTIPEPEDEITMSMDPTDLLSAMTNICKTYDLGFRITRNGDHGELYFNVYSGIDRTSAQTDTAPVVFAPNLDNLENSTYLISNKQYRNVAYIFGAEASSKVYGTGVDPDSAGFVRRVLTVNASDLKYPDRNTFGPGETPVYTVTEDQENAIKAAQNLDSTTQFQVDSLGKLSKRQRLYPQDDVNIETALTAAGANLTTAQKNHILDAMETSHDYDETEDIVYEALLQARGRQELAACNSITAFDGEIPEYGSYRYEVDYFLGDMVEVRDADGVVNQVRVTEQIFAQDGEGERSYPTLSSRLLITPGVWAAWDSNQEWAGVPDTTHWADLP